MRKNLIYLSSLALLVGLVIYFSLNTNRPGRFPDKSTIDISKLLSHDETGDVFLKALKPVEFIFPDDHGPHQKFQTEWWYFTGNLKGRYGSTFGYQLTFFRRALGNYSKIKSASDWRSNTLYFAHFALSDINKNKYYSFEKWSRGAQNLSGARSTPFRVWIDNWSVELEKGRFLLESSINDVSIKFELEPVKNIVSHGNKGLSHKSIDRKNASYYYSYTRLNTSGELKIRDRVYSVEGSSWFDHEWSTSVLSNKQAGWDWFSIQLDNNTEVMIYQLRFKDGSVDPVSSGTYVDERGKSVHLDSSEFEIDILDTWKSPNTLSEYPSKWNLEIPKLNIKLLIEPYLNGQEFSHSFTYWEGAVKASGNTTRGSGYVELTGY